MPISNSYNTLGRRVLAMAITTTSTILLALFSTFLAAAAEHNNVLLTGDVLETGRSLLTQDATFIMQADCNLVLYDYVAGSGRGFQSDTHGNGVNCSLALNDVGQIVISGSSGETIWWAPASYFSTKGRYAAVLRPDSVVAIYGPLVWAAPYTRFSAAHSSSSSSSRRSLYTTSANNLMFSGETLRSPSQLVAGRDYMFVMQRDCNLALFHAGSVAWSTSTQGNGAHCFARLGHDGELTVADDRNQIVWSSNSTSTAGDYVLVLQTNGQAEIYGPIVWSTPTTNSVLLPGFSVV